MSKNTRGPRAHTHKYEQRYYADGSSSCRQMHTWTHTHDPHQANIIIVEQFSVVACYYRKTLLPLLIFKKHQHIASAIS